LLARRRREQLRHNCVGDWLHAFREGAPRSLLARAPHVVRVGLRARVREDERGDALRVGAHEGEGRVASH
jgi:hypothetical protein